MKMRTKGLILLLLALFCAVMSSGCGQKAATGGGGGGGGNGGGNAIIDWSKEPIEAPYGLTTDNQGVTSNTVYLTWGHEKKINDPRSIGYRIYQDQGNVPVMEAVENAATIPGLSPDTQYEFRVTAFAGDIESPKSDSLTVRTLPAPPVPDTTAPTKPGNVVATAQSPTEILVSWSAPTDNVGVVGYDVQKKLGGVVTDIGSVVTISFVDSGLVPDTDYEYRVRAYDGANNKSAWSEWVPATTDELLPPQNLTATVSYDPFNIHLSWSAATGAVSYKIVRNGIGPATPYGYKEWSQTSEEVDDSDISPLIKYTYCVSSVDGNGGESDSSLIEVEVWNPSPILFVLSGNDVSASLTAVGSKNDVVIIEKKMYDPNDLGVLPLDLQASLGGKRFLCQVGMWLTEISPLGTYYPTSVKLEIFDILYDFEKEIMGTGRYDNYLMGIGAMDKGSGVYVGANGLDGGSWVFFCEEGWPSMRACFVDHEFVNFMAAEGNLLCFVLMDDRMAVFDTDTMSVKGIVNIENGSDYAVIKHGYIYVSNYESGNVYVVEKDTLEVSMVINFGKGCRITKIAINDEGRLVVLDRSGGRVIVYDMESSSQTEISVEIGGTLFYLAVAPGKIYAASKGYRQVVAIDTNTWQLTSLTMPEEVRGLAVLDPANNQ